MSQRHITAHALAGLLGDWRGGPGPMYERLCRRLGQLLSDGRVAPGVRLPAERPLAAELGISRTTVVRTYAALREQGLLESRRGAGSVTRLSQGSVEHFLPWAGAARLNGHAAPVIDLTKASPKAGEAVVAALRAAAEQAGALVGHHGYQPLGLASLRAAVAARYELRGVPTAPEQILITSGAQQAIDLLVRTFVRSRETVVVESPTYPGAIDSLRLAGARMVSLDVSANPWQLDALQALLAQTGARFAYLMPDFHNPTGRLMRDAQREELVRHCRRHGVTLIIDETLAEIALDPDAVARPIAGHDPSDGVITVGSLSKAVWAGLRVGWIRASPRQLSAVAATRTTADLSGAPLEQIAAVALLADLDAHLERSRPSLTRQRDALAAAVTPAGWRLDLPSGGLSAWAELPSGSSSLLADVAYRSGVTLIPGPRLSPDGALDRYLRLPYSLPVETIRAAIERLSRAWHDAEPAAGGDPVLQIV
ncbi:MAG TPA: PLP-dependent aminotransferase family protein [Solirubrobacteraceae bacterium]|nr:PLP-dependent aminotransferase family protein [Solirubrobacteraceae bacterium]